MGFSLALVGLEVNVGEPLTRYARNTRHRGGSVVRSRGERVVLGVGDLHASSSRSASRSRWFTQRGSPLRARRESPSESCSSVTVDRAQAYLKRS
jgi:hypothetical protein